MAKGPVEGLKCTPLVYFQSQWGTTEATVTYMTLTKVSKAKPGRSDFLAKGNPLQCALWESARTPSKKTYIRSPKLDQRCLLQGEVARQV